MSGSGQSRPNYAVTNMSGLTQFATELRSSREGGFVPIPEVASLFDRSMRALNVGGNSSNAAPHQSSSRQVTTYSNAAIASTTGQGSDLHRRQAGDHVR